MYMRGNSCALHGQPALGKSGPGLDQVWARSGLVVWTWTRAQIETLMFGDSPKIRILKFGPVSIISAATVNLTADATSSRNPVHHTGLSAQTHMWARISPYNLHTICM